MTNKYVFKPVSDILMEKKRAADEDKPFMFDISTPYDVSEFRLKAAVQSMTQLAYRLTNAQTQRFWIRTSTFPWFVTHRQFGLFVLPAQF